jgi:broad specificity phosphatase PhoE
VANGKSNSSVGSGNDLHDGSTRRVDVAEDYYSTTPKGTAPQGRTRRILVITHGGFIREMINVHVKGVDAKNNSKNCSITVMTGELDPLSGSPRWDIHRHNDVDHVRRILVVKMHATCSFLLALRSATFPHQPCDNLYRHLASIDNYN